MSRSVSGLPQPHREHVALVAEQPVRVRNHLVVGVSGDFDNLPGILRSFDPVTGAAQWTFYSTPPAGTPDSPSGGATGGQMWMTGTHDPELNLLFVGTGNPGRGNLKVTVYELDRATAIAADKIGTQFIHASPSGATTFALAAGSHTIQFKGLNSRNSDNAALIDDVRLVLIV